MLHSYFLWQKKMYVLLFLANNNNKKKDRSDSKQNEVHKRFKTPKKIMDFASLFNFLLEHKFCEQSCSYNAKSLDEVPSIRVSSITRKSRNIQGVKHDSDNMDFWRCIKSERNLWNTEIGKEKMWKESTYVHIEWQVLLVESDADFDRWEEYWLFLLPLSTPIPNF